MTNAYGSWALDNLSLPAHVLDYLLPSSRSYCPLLVLEDTVPHTGFVKPRFLIDNNNPRSRKLYNTLVVSHVFSRGHQSISAVGEDTPIHTTTQYHTWTVTTKQISTFLLPADQGARWRCTQSRPLTAPQIAPCDFFARVFDKAPQSCRFFNVFFYREKDIC